MKKIALSVCLIFTFFANSVSQISAQSSYAPALVLSPNTEINANNEYVFRLDMVNMGVPLSEAEIAVHVEGTPWPNDGLQVTQLNAPQLQYVDHYFEGYSGEPYQVAVIKFKASTPNGYNQGSSQVPIVQFRLPAHSKSVTAHVVTDKTKLYDLDGNPLPSIQTFGSRTYYNPNASQFEATTGYSNPLPSSSPTTPSNRQEAQLKLLEQQIGELKTQVDQQSEVIKEQNVKIQENSSLLEKIKGFLVRLFKFN